MKRSRIAPYSTKRRSRDAGWADARAAVLESGLCDAAVHPSICAGRATAVHHIAGRGGPDPHRFDNLLAVCAPCHDHIHAHPARSYEQGWMKRRNTTLEDR